MMFTVSLKKILTILQVLPIQCDTLKCSLLYLIYFYFLVFQMTNDIKLARNSQSHMPLLNTLE
jgi:hypothetical protein